MDRKYTAWPVALAAAMLTQVGTASAGTPTLAQRPKVAVAQAAPAKRTPASRLVRPKAVAQTDRYRPDAPAPGRDRRPALDFGTPQFEEMPADEADDLLPGTPQPPRYAPDGALPENTPAEEPLSEPAGQPRYLLEDDQVEERAEEEVEETLPPPVEPTPRDVPRANQPTPAPTPAPAKPLAARGAIYRLEPPNQLIAVPREELKPGVIYLHDSPRLGRQVWSFLQANGEFWHAFGPGTTQAVEQFDFRMTPEQANEALKNIDPKLAFEVSSSAGAKVFMRLDTDNTWQLVRKGSVSSIYDLETEQRWEKQWDRYLPVVHLNGDTWEYRNQSYQAPNWGEWMRPN